MEIGAANRTALEAAIVQIETMGPEALGAFIPICRIDEVSDGLQARLLISMITWPTRPAFLAAMNQLGNGVSYRSGGPPPGYLEDELGAWIQQLRI